MNKQILMAFAAAMALSARAQVKMPTWLSNVKLSGYGMTQYRYSTRKDAEPSSFNVRMVRLSLDGRIANDFYWKAQVQFNGNTASLGSSPRLVDAFAEWQKTDYLRIKMGQFKRPFSFENPMHPMEQGFMSYAQTILKLTGFNDRAGGHASNGRDIGLQLQGDILSNSHGRKLLHYQVGVFNGQGINVKDADQKKDIIGGLWVMPVKGMRIGAFGWTGTYARKGTWNVVDERHNPVTTTDASGKTVNQTQSGVRSLRQNRYAFSAEYLVNDWTFRSEYIHSTGLSFTQTCQNPANATDANINYKAGDQADGAYALVMAPIIKSKLRVKARYDMYRPTGEWNQSKTQYEIGCNYSFTKNMLISAEYAFNNDRSPADGNHNYSVIDVQVDYRF